jgi:hypothetical protein
LYDVVDESGGKVESSLKMSFLDFVVVEVGVTGGERNIPFALGGMDELIRRDEALDADVGRLFVFGVGGMVSLASD